MIAKPMPFAVNLTKKGKFVGTLRFPDEYALAKRLKTCLERSSIQAVGARRHAVEYLIKQIRQGQVVAVNTLDGRNYRFYCMKAPEPGKVS